jgi:hypothetical protein
MAAPVGKAAISQDGLRLQFPQNESIATTATTELSVFGLSLQQTTYFKIFTNSSNTSHHRSHHSIDFCGARTTLPDRGRVFSEHANMEKQISIGCIGAKNVGGKGSKMPSNRSKYYFRPLSPNYPAYPPTSLKSCLV